MTGKCNLNAETLKISAIACDASSEASVIKAYTIIMEKYGRVDVVVASAGIVENYPALEYVLLSFPLHCKGFISQVPDRSSQAAVRCQCAWCILHSSRGRSKYDT